MTDTNPILIPRTPAEKLEVLTKARALLETNFGKHNWVCVIDEVEHYCLYGAIETAMGYDLLGELMEVVPEKAELNQVDEDEILKSPTEFFEPDHHDDDVSECSLTSTMYETALKTGFASISHHRKILALESGEMSRIEMEYKYRPKSSIYAMMENPESEIMRLKVESLQHMNDRMGQKAVLEVLDATIEELRAEVDA